jgi:hypothetical protein
MALFNSQNAAEMAARSHEARRQRVLMPAIYLNPQPQHAGDYVASRLVRVREQLNRLDSIMAKETDPQRLDRLASAQSKLSEQERILDGRPLPGQRRPPPDVFKRREMPREEPVMWQPQTATSG